MRPAMKHIEEAYASWQNQRDLPSDLTTAQDQAFARACEHGLPWRQDEHWKYTSLFGLAKLPLTVTATAAEKPNDHVAQIYAPNEAWSVTLLDGHLVHDDLPDSIQLTINHAPDKRIVARHSVMQELNQAFANGIVELDVADNTTLNKPLYVRLMSSDTNHLSSPRVQLKMGRNASCTLIEHVGSGNRANASSVCNSFMTIDIGENSRVQHTRVQEAAVGAWEFTNTDVTVPAPASITNDA